MTRTMDKTTFVEMIQTLVKEPVTGYKDSETQLGIGDFDNWQDWFTYGEWNHGPRKIEVEPKTRKAMAFLKKYNFN